MIIDNIFVLTESLIMPDDDDDLEMLSTDHTVFSSNLSFVGIYLFDIDNLLRICLSVGMSEGL